MHLSRARSSSCTRRTPGRKSRLKTRPPTRTWSSASRRMKAPRDLPGGCTRERRRQNWTRGYLCWISSRAWMVRLPHASPQPDHPPNTARPRMWPHVQTRAVQGTRARRGVVDARVRSCHGVVGAHRSKERLSAGARRSWVGVIVVRRLHGGSHRFGFPE